MKEKHLTESDALETVTGTLIQQDRLGISIDKARRTFQTHKDILREIYRNTDNSLRLRHLAGEMFALLCSVDELINFAGEIERTGDTGYLQILTHQMLYEYASGVRRCNEKQHKAVKRCLQHQMKNTDNQAFRLICAVHLTRIGEVDALGIVVEQVEVFKYMSDTAVRKNGWGKATGTLPYLPSVRLRTYKDAVRFLREYTGQSFSTAAEWQSWYRKNKGRLRWDGERKKFVVKCGGDPKGSMVFLMLAVCAGIGGGFVSGRAAWRKYTGGRDAGKDDKQA